MLPLIFKRIFMILRPSHFGILLLGVLLTSCTYGQSSLLGQGDTPTQAVEVTSSPSVSVSTCKPVEVTQFKNTREFTVGPLAYTLLGVDFFPGYTLPASMMQRLEKETFCIKEDPSVDDGSFVYALTAESTLLNAELIQKGFAKVATQQDYVYKSYFTNLQKEAETNKVGFWDPNYKDEDLSGSSATSTAQLVEEGVTDLSKLTSGTTTTQNTSAGVTDTKKAHSLIFPQQARSNIGATVVLRMKVASLGKTPGAYYLNSHADYTNAENVSVFFDLPTTDMTLQDVIKADKKVLDQYVEVTGIVRELDGKMQMKVERGENIRLVKM